MSEPINTDAPATKGCAWVRGYIAATVTVILESDDRRLATQLMAGAGSYALVLASADPEDIETLREHGYLQNPELSTAKRVDE